MGRVYTLKVDESGIIEYLEDNEVLEDIYTSLQRMEEMIMDMRMVLESSSEESDNQIDDIDFKTHPALSRPDAFFTYKVKIVYQIE